jgi:signal transduction histidine kinase
MVIAVIAIMVGVTLFLVVGITRKRNADPNQQQLAQLLINAA